VEQPPNYYRLLGIPLFESDPDVIANAAEQRIAHVRAFQVGPHSDESQRILKELSIARVCLLDAKKKAQYDARLQPPRGRGAVVGAVEQTAQQLPPARGRARRRLGAYKPLWAKAGAGLAAVGVTVAVVLTVILMNGDDAEITDRLPTPAPKTPPEPQPKTPVPSTGGNRPPDVPAVEDPFQSPPTPPAPASRTEPSPTPTPPEDEPSDASEPVVSKPEPPMETLEQAEQRLTAEAGKAASPAEFQRLTEDLLVQIDRATLDSQAAVAQRLGELALKTARRSESNELNNQVALLFAVDLKQPTSETTKSRARARLGKRGISVDPTSGPTTLPSGQPSVGGQPPKAVAPFDSATARRRQEQWAAHLRVPLEVTNSTGMRLVLIPPGEFMMGPAVGDSGAFSDEQPQHKVRITSPYYLGATEVTREQYERVTGKKPSRFLGDLRLPVEQVSWEDAVDFCHKLSAKEGDTYRLPTEAEWEYACRAGTTTPWNCGAAEFELAAHAWYQENSDGQTHPAGLKKPNAWGLHDMHGSVSEWCLDWYDAGYYLASPTEDPAGPAAGSDRVSRGGSWLSVRWACRSASRSRHAPTTPDHYRGFRVARTIPLQREPVAGPAPGGSN
jgi:formylglycine-generating enzyme required for sulfatase activity